MVIHSGSRREHGGPLSSGGSGLRGIPMGLLLALTYAS